MIWHAESAEHIVAELGTDAERGLSLRQAEERQKQFGANLPTMKRPIGLGRRLLRQLSSPTLILLAVATVIAVAVGIYRASRGTPNPFAEPLVLLLLTAITVVIGAVQEDRAERTLASVTSASVCSARVMREGEWSVIPASELVPGDVVEVREGDLCPADCRLLSSMNLFCDERWLTGAELLAEKHAEATPEGIATLAERANMLFAGCAVTGGSGIAVVTEIGAMTEQGKAEALLSPKERVSLPVQNTLKKILRTLGFAAIGAGVLMLLFCLFEKQDFFLSLLTAASLIVAVIPEGLAAIVTVVLALGVSRLVRHGVTVRHFHAAETLGKVSVICTDRTGVFSRNQPVLQSVFVSGGMYAAENSDRPDVKMLVRLAALCTDGTVRSNGKKEVVDGNPYETAILSAAHRLGMDQELLLTDYPRVGTLPFDKQRKRMTTVHLYDGQAIVVVKGAPEVVLELCDDVDESAVADAYWQMGNRAERVLAVAFKMIDPAAEHTPESLENHLSFAGLLGLYDPPRTTAFDALRRCRDAGITPVMITGEHISAATALAKELHLIKSEDEAVDGAMLAAMSDAEFAENIRKFRVYARVSPSDKCRIVRTWQQAGEVVAVTGQTVGDVQALQTADVSFALAKDADDASIGSADIVMQDSRFSALLDTIAAGRCIYERIRRVTRFFLTCSLAELLVMLIGVWMKSKSPLLPIHLLWINLITVGLPLFAFGADGFEPFFLKRPPRKKSEPFLLMPEGMWFVPEAMLVAALTILVYAVAGQTAAFVSLVLTELIYAFSLRSPAPLYKADWHIHSQTVLAFGVGVLLTLGAVLLPSVRGLFSAEVMDGAKWLLCLVCAVLPLAVAECVKTVKLILAKR